MPASGFALQPAQGEPFVQGVSQGGWLCLLGSDGSRQGGTTLFTWETPGKRSADHYFGKWGLKLAERWATLEEAAADPRLLIRPPTQAADLPMYFSMSRKWHELSFSLADLKLEVYVTVCWQTPRFQDGPYCPIVSRIIA